MRTSYCTDSGLAPGIERPYEIADVQGDDRSGRPPSPVSQCGRVNRGFAAWGRGIRSTIDLAVPERIEGQGRGPDHLAGPRQRSVEPLEYLAAHPAGLPLR